MSASDKARQIICPFESCRLAAYLCPAGVPTLGWGSTGPDIRLGMVWTQAQADARLMADIGRFAAGVGKLAKVPLNEFQVGALTSFSYNCGLAALEKSTLLALVNARRFPEAAAQFLRWNRAGGCVLAGLTRRRLAEKAMFSTV